MKLFFVTGNKHKLEEAQKLLAGFEIEQIIIDVAELQGEPEEIAREKARIACSKTGKTVFVEDTSLSFNAWNGLPGPYIRSFVEKIGIQNFTRLLSGFDDKTATAMVSIGFCEPGKEPLVFQGSVRGTIVLPRGADRFQWDRVFVPEGDKRTYAEMTVDEKNNISHRRKAFEKFRDWLEKRNKIKK